MWKAIKLAIRTEALFCNFGLTGARIARYNIFASVNSQIFPRLARKFAGGMLS